MSTKDTTKNNGWITALIIAAIALLAAFPMFFNFGDPEAEESFGGADGAATELVEESNPDYKPWFKPVIGELPGEVESGIFALQAGLGAGVLGYVLGNYRGRSQERSRREADNASRSAADVGNTTS
ncbi:energy-coupling factor ABC transporter substrate-binding protein [Corynebacterium sp. H113]|uniref:energy-coupling factor ABC transporter substrate-binding protein n=1 Tax=Corynebacterium sp. H113 TaxID=3133419 RepID=UPI0030B1EF46